MTAGLEMATVRQWLDATLNNDAALTTLLSSHGAWGSGTAPPRTSYPFVVYQFMSGVDYAAVGAYRIWTNMVWLVKAIGETADVTTLDAIVARIDVLLHRGSGTPASGTVWSCERQTTIDYPESIEGDQFRHLGGTYRIYAS